jgi:hypothetical protein
MIKVTVATLLDIEEAIQYKKEIFNGEKDLKEGMRNTRKHGHLFCLRDDWGRLGCLVGFTYVWSGVASCCAVTTEFLDEHPIGYSRAVLDILNHGMPKFGVHRCEIYVKCGHKAAFAWAGFMGFEVEGMLKMYGPDKSDYYIMGRVAK